MNNEFSKTGYWFYDFQNGELFCPEAWLKSVGIKNKGTIKIDEIFRIIFPEEQKRFINNIEEILTSEKRQLEFILESKLKKIKLLYVKGEVFRWDNSGFPVNMAGIVFPLSEVPREREKEILKFNYSIIASKLKSIDTENKRNKYPGTGNGKATDLIYDFSEFKENVLSNLNHELRTPLTGIIGFSSILKSELTNIPFKMMAEKIYFSAKRLMTTYSKILILAEIETGMVACSIEELSLNSLISKCSQQYIKDAEEKDLKFSITFYKKDIRIKTDENLFSHLISNLIENAVKFTHSGEIKVTVKKIKRDDNYFCEIIISDTGIGIAPDKTEIIFDSFRQASEGYSRKYEGNGLGLYLVKKILLIIGGEIYFKTPADGGSEFSILLPEKKA